MTPRQSSYPFTYSSQILSHPRIFFVASLFYFLTACTEPWLTNLARWLRGETTVESRLLDRE